MSKRRSNIKETAAGGSTAGGSIAVSHDRMGGMRSRKSFKDFMDRFQQRIKNKYGYKEITFEGKGNASIKNAGIMENTQHPYQLDNVVSRLKGMDRDTDFDAKDTVDFGVEDDDNNIMKISVPIQQAEEFERRMAQALADVVDFKKTGKGEDKSLAELLYELKDEFTILDVQFPRIPSDAIYNADEATTIEDDTIGEQDEFSPEDEEDELDQEDQDQKDQQSDEQDGGKDEEDQEDDESVEDFSEEPSDTDSLLRSVIDMLQSQSEERKAKALADAEEAKARQAELSRMAADKSLEREEELLGAEAEMEQEKEQDKEAKRLADLAKYRYKKSKGDEGNGAGIGEGRESFLKNVFLKEVGEFETPDTLRRKRGTIKRKYAPEPGDDSETARYKRDQMQHELRSINMKINRAEEKERQQRRNRGRDGQQDQEDTEEV